MPPAQNESNRRVSVGAESVDSARWRALKAGDGADGSSAEENIVLREGILFQVWLYTAERVYFVFCLLNGVLRCCCCRLVHRLLLLSA